VTLIFENETDRQLEGVDMQALAMRVCETALDEIGCPFEAQISLTITDSEGIRQINRELYVDSRYKSGNESIYLAVDSIQTAIEQKKKISFQYFDYAPDKTKLLRHDGRRYSVSPYALIWNNDAYYLIGYHDMRGIVTRFRADRITSLEVMDAPAVDRLADFNVSAFFSKEFSMLGGKDCEVELLCQNDLMGNIIDRFGEQVPTEIVDENNFKVTVTVALSNNFYGWVFASAGNIQILSPPQAIAEFRQLLSHYE